MFGNGKLAEDDFGGESGFSSRPKVSVRSEGVAILDSEGVGTLHGGFARGLA